MENKDIFEDKIQFIRARLHTFDQWKIKFQVSQLNAMRKAMFPEKTSEFSYTYSNQHPCELLYRKKEADKFKPYDSFSEEFYSCVSSIERLEGSIKRMKLTPKMCIGGC